jgi:hypothetical protein
VLRIREAIHVGLNRLRNRFSKRRYPADRVLLLLSHCLQNSDCSVRLKGNIALCEECGRCKMKELKGLSTRLGVKTFIATGGRDAARRAREDDTDLVVAVACHRELAEGITAVFPKRVVGLQNTWPHGECVDTDVDVDKLAALLNDLLQEDALTQEAKASP